MKGDFTVHSANDFAGGMVGRGDGTVIAASDDAHVSDIKLWTQGTVEYEATGRGSSIEGLRSVTADGSYAGGIAGGLAGLKFGFGESVGPWKFVDKAFSANKGQVAAAKDPERSRQRRKRDLARRRGEKVDEPELMSVAPQHEDASGNKKH